MHLVELEIRFTNDEIIITSGTVRSFKILT